MITVYLIRHGKSGASRSRRQKQKTELSSTGRFQAALVAEKLPFELNHIYSSPLTRALQTAEIIASKRGLKPITKSELREIDRPPQFYGASYNDPDHVEYIRQRRNAIRNHLIDWRYNNQGESFRDLQLRTTYIKYWIEDKFSNESLVLVTHSNFAPFLTNVMLYGDDCPPHILFNNFRPYFLDYGGLAILQFDENTSKWSLIYHDKRANAH